jgi:hypothetical protein
MDVAFGQKSRLEISPCLRPISAIAVIAQRHGKTAKTTLCCPLGSALQTDGKHQKAVFG